MKIRYKARILVVDDDQTVCRSVAQVLKSEGHEVDLAFSAAQALEQIHQQKYALVLQDLMLPDMDGAELLQEIRRQKPDITVIMITGYPSIGTAVHCTKKGAFDYVAKPFTPAELRTLATRALEFRQTYEEVTARMGIEEERLVELILPEGFYCIPKNAWAQPLPEGAVRVGAHHCMTRCLKCLTSIDCIEAGQFCLQGEPCATLYDSQQGVHRLWTPVSGRVLLVNRSVLENPTLIQHDPYDKGWLLTLAPTNWEHDLNNLSPLDA
ncbi:MAG: response regulator [Acidobacteria bacterium]|nr:response regulator [Acidobacteriota bacterium]